MTSDAMTAIQALDQMLDADYWGTNGTPHDALRLLRRDHPVARYEGGAVDPFWLVTRHADVEAVSKDPGLWSSATRAILDQPRDQPQRLRSIVHIDPPEHTRHRAVIAGWMTPRVVRQLEARMREVSRELVDRMASGDTCDFVADVAAVHPVRLLCELLGIDRSQEAEVLRLTKLIFAAHDDEFVAHGETPIAPEREIFGFCQSLVERSEAKAGEDLVSAIVHAEIDGERIGRHEMLSNLAVILTAGHDTTASAISGAMLALARHPNQLDKLRGDMALIPHAIEEFTRWVTPTTNFVRTATRDTDIRGVPIRAGDDVCIHYSAANRDEAVFADPYAFRIDRRPNKHLSFGIGTHNCVGQILARMEMRTLFEELIPRLHSLELAGDPTFVKAYWVSGLKRLPIHYRLT